MQYILTESEMLDLQQKAERALKLPNHELQELCTQIAITMPISVPDWETRGHKPWGCILINPARGRSTPNYIPYCDKCPVREICPNEHKEWSK